MLYCSPRLSPMCDPRELRSRAGGANGRRRQRSKPNLASVMDNFRDDNFSPRPDANELNRAMSGDTSPDSKCPICLDTFENVAFLDRCWHRFCFRCVQEWSKNKAECPLCKQPFHSILHSMRSEDNFQVYTVRPLATASFANPNGRRFRYRTTATRPHGAPVYSQSNNSSQRTASPPDNGILFERSSGQTTQQREAEMHQMMRRLASRRQASLEGRTMRHIQEAEIIRFRRALYRSGTRVRSIDDGGRYRDISADFFRRNPACLHRLVPWLKRELTVLFGAHGSLINIVQHLIMSNVTRYDMESQAFSDDLRPFLLNRTEHFLHEFISFARCPFNIDAYDQHANYDCPAPSYEEGSRSESSIITISPDSDEPSYSAFTSGTNQAPWDDETPGPSYSNSEQVRASLTTALDTSESSDGEPSSTAAVVQAQIPANVYMNGDSCDSSDNCVIVGYVKPLAERTPELVQLSSDSAESGEARKTEVAQVQPIQYHSFSDSDASGYASPLSIGSRDGSASNKTNASPSSKKQKSKRSERERSKSRESATRIQSPSTGQVDEGCSSPKRRKTESSAQRSHRERHGQKSKRKHRSVEKKKKKRDGSRHKHRKDKKRSRTRDKSLSRKSQAPSFSSESAGSRERSRSRSRSNEYIRTSKSRDDDDYLKDNCQSKYKCEYTFYSCNNTQDGYESPYRRQMQARAQCSRENASPNNEMQSFSERTHRSRSLRDHSENKYERHRSRSRSSSRSQTPARGQDRTRSEKPSGKRKYKTHHLESAHRGTEEASSSKEHSGLETALAKYQGFNNNATSSLDSQPELEIRHKKPKKRSRSPSVEIVYEGQATDTTRHHKKKRKREKKSRKSHVSHSQFSSPVVITINSDSDKDTGIQDNTDCNSNSSCSPTLQPNEKETESLSPVVEARDSSHEAGESENVDKDSSMTTPRIEMVGETSTALVPLQAPANRHALTVTDGTSFNIVNQASAVEIQSFSQLPTVRTTLFVRLSEMLRKVSHPLDSPEQNV